MNSWPRRRFRVTPLRVSCAFLFVGALFWYNLDREEIPPPPCSMPEEFTEKLHELVFRVHLVLAKLGIVHFLCFGALWGQVRIGRALPWARKIELCLVDTLRDDGLITKAFREAGLSASYMYASGVYRVQERNADDYSPRVEIFVFEEDSVTQMIRRVGWTRRVLPPDCELSPSLQCFPPQLVIPPLPAKQFGGRLLPVPREGIELQKYHYPNDWWLEMKPTDCVELNQFLFLLALTVFLMELVQLSEAYTSIKSLKYPRQKYWSRRPQWHSFPHLPRRRLRRRRFKSRYNHEKYHERYPHYQVHNQRPFTIELELPDHHDDHQEKYLKPWRSSRDNVRYVTPEEYEDEDRKVRIKVVEEGKSHIRLKISRNDNSEAEQNVNNMHNNSIPIESIAYSKTPLHRTEYTVPIVHSWNGE